MNIDTRAKDVADFGNQLIERTVCSLSSHIDRVKRAPLWVFQRRLKSKLVRTSFHHWSRMPGHFDLWNQTHTAHSCILYKSTKFLPGVMLFRCRQFRKSMGRKGERSIVAQVKLHVIDLVP